MIAQRENRISDLEEHNKEIRELEQKIIDLQLELQETNTFHTGCFMNKTTTQANEETQFNVTETDIDELIIEKQRNFSEENLRFVEEALVEGLTKHHTIFDESMDEASLYVNKQLREQLRGAWVVSLGPKGTSLCFDCKTTSIA